MSETETLKDLRRIIVIVAEQDLATAYTDDTVAAEGSYVYRVKVVNRHGASMWSSYSRADIP